MAQLFFTNLDSDISGYKLLLVNERNPVTPTAIASAVTTTTNGGSSIPVTITEGGTALKFITKPLKVAVTLASLPIFSLWAKESNASANAGMEMRFYQYTAGAQGSSLLSSEFGTELTTSSALQQWIGAAISSTVFAVGDRIVVVPYIDNVGTMGASQTVTFYYDGILGSNADGDSRMFIAEDLRLSESQVGSGSTPTVRGVGVSWFYDLRESVQHAIDAGMISANTQAQQIIDEADAQMDLV